MPVAATNRVKAAGHSTFPGKRREHTRSQATLTCHSEILARQHPTLAEYADRERLGLVVAQHDGPRSTARPGIRQML